MIKLSVVICAHNPRTDYLRRVLAALQGQTLPQSEWELLLVDNRSKEPLAPAWDLSWHPNAHHVFEGELGLAAARQRGMHEMCTDLVIFVDDDNILQPNYLSEVLNISAEWPQLGVWGSGNTTLELESEPAEHLKEFLSLLGRRTVDAPRWSNVSTCGAAAPWGAGLCVRARVATAYHELSRRSAIRVSGRTGNSLLSGEDIEVGYTACRLGYGMGVFPQLKQVHLIPNEKLTEEYFLRRHEGYTFSILVVEYKWHGIIPRDPLSPRALLSAFKNSLVRRGVQRKMYHAHLRATLRARRLIAVNQRSSMPEVGEDGAVDGNIG